MRQTPPARYCEHLFRHPSLLRTWLCRSLADNPPPKMMGQYTITRLHVHRPTDWARWVGTFIENTGLEKTVSETVSQCKPPLLNHTPSVAGFHNRVSVRIWTLAAENEHPR